MRKDKWAGWPQDALTFKANSSAATPLRQAKAAVGFNGKQKNAKYEATKWGKLQKNQPALTSQRQQQAL
jgi:hypothetical protein